MGKRRGCETKKAVGLKYMACVDCSNRYGSRECKDFRRENEMKVVLRV
jgi:hypothetical protein